MNYVLIALAVASRFLPHPPNVAMIGALGLFAGCYLGGRRAFWVPAAALLISDAIGHVAGVPGLGFYSPVIMACVYGGMMASVPIGRWIAGGNRWIRTPMASVAASTVFFVVSNLGVFASGMYSFTPAGLVACFTSAIPFYGYTLIGDLGFSVIMFGAAAISFSSSKSLVRNSAALQA